MPLTENVTNSEPLNQAYNEFEDTFTNILNKHAPIKTRQPRKQPLPFMNNIRKAVYRKHKLYTHFTKHKDPKTWGKYRKQRNLVTKLLKKYP